MLCVLLGLLIVCGVFCMAWLACYGRVAYLFVLSVFLVAVFLGGCCVCFGCVALC